MENLNEYIEHTLLSPTATSADIKKLCKEAIANKFHAVCVNPCHVTQAAKLLENSRVNLVAVIGFPLGQNEIEIKAYEAATAFQRGADEIDVVMNIGKLKEKDYDYITREIKTLKRSTKRVKIMKYIIETDYLTRDEIIKATDLAAKCGADFVKTSTGYAKDGIGAKVNDIKLIIQTGSGKLRVKASGGIRTLSDAEKMIKAGASRIGTSNAMAIWAEYKKSMKKTPKKSKITKVVSKTSKKK